jgi:hypothetical protein
MPLEHCRAPRHRHGWAIEVIDIQSGIGLEATTGDIGLFGCFVETATPFRGGRRIALKITHDNRTFSAAGEVTYALADRGMSIAFTALAPGDYAILKEWLSGDAQNGPQQQPTGPAKA